jgi:hypothetical protein
MRKIYPAATIQQAKELFEQRMSYPQIAECLNIKRSETIAEWKKKYGWEKPLKNDIDEKAQKNIWKAISDTALKYLKKEKNFTSMRDALNVYEKALGRLNSLKKKKASPKKTLLGMLEEKDEDLDEESLDKEILENED